MNVKLQVRSYEHIKYGTQYEVLSILLGYFDSVACLNEYAMASLLFIVVVLF